MIETSHVDPQKKFSRLDNYFLIPFVAAVGTYAAERFVSGEALPIRVAAISLVWLSIFQLLGRGVAGIAFGSNSKLKPVLISVLPAILANISLVAINQLIVTLPLPESLLLLFLELQQPYRFVTLTVFSILNLFERLLEYERILPSPKRRLFTWATVMIACLLLLFSYNLIEPSFLPPFSPEPTAEVLIASASADENLLPPSLSATPTNINLDRDVYSSLPTNSTPPVPNNLTTELVVVPTSLPTHEISQNNENTVGLIVNECNYVQSVEYLYLYESPVFTKPKEGRVEVPQPYELLALEWVPDPTLNVINDVRYRIVIWKAVDYEQSGEQTNPVSCLVRSEQWLHVGNSPESVPGSYIYRFQNVQVNDKEQIIRFLTPLSDRLLYVTWQ